MYLPSVALTDDDLVLDYLSWSHPGPYRSPTQRSFPIQSFGASQKVVATYFFYWFDAATYRDSQTRRSFDPCPFHPPNLETIGFLDPDWYEKEFRDMVSAEIPPQHWAAIDGKPLAWFL